MWAQKPREDRILEKRVEKGKRDGEKKIWSKDKMFSLVLFSAAGFYTKLLFK